MDWLWYFYVAWACMAAGVFLGAKFGLRAKTVGDFAWLMLLWPIVLHEAWKRERANQGVSHEG